MTWILNIHHLICQQTKTIQWLLFKLLTTTSTEDDFFRHFQEYMVTTSFPLPLTINTRLSPSCQHLQVFHIWYFKLSRNPRFNQSFYQYRKMKSITYHSLFFYSTFYLYFCFYFMLGHSPESHYSTRFAVLIGICVIMQKVWAMETKPKPRYNQILAINDQVIMRLERNCKRDLLSAHHDTSSSAAF